MTGELTPVHIIDPYQPSIYCRANDYAVAHEAMSLLGINKNILTDCTEIMPASVDLKPLAIKTTGKQSVDPTSNPSSSRRRSRNSGPFGFELGRFGCFIWALG
jgi:hypothetical protein